LCGQDKENILKDRIEYVPLRECITDAAEAVRAIGKGMTVAMSGYAMAGFPKAIPDELVRRKEKEQDLSLVLLTGSNVPYLDEKLASAGIINRRIPMCASKTLAAQINAGKVHYTEQQMGKMPRLLRSGVLGDIDVLVVEAAGITKEGYLIPTSSVGMVPRFAKLAKTIIVEMNSCNADSFIGMHDIYMPEDPPDTRPIPLTRTAQRIGTPYISVDINKIKYIIHTNEPEQFGNLYQESEVNKRTVMNLFNFLELTFGKKLPPIQTGFGGIASCITNGLQGAVFENLEFFCGGADESMIDLLFSGKAAAVSAGGIAAGKKAIRKMREIPQCSERMVIRNGDIANSSEIISRLGVVSINTGIEVDIYGNVNCSHIAGSRVVNGIGGGADFAQNAGLSIIAVTSTGKNGTISNVVPMVSHQDICEHDVDILVTENGVADLRGLDDAERAQAVIQCCASRIYRDQLADHLKKAQRISGGHHPQLPTEAFDWYRQLKETGSMLPGGCDG